MFIKALRKHHFAQTVLVTLFAGSLLIAQLATTNHDAHHPFHKHSHLCDSFANFDHSKNPLVQATPLIVAIEISSTHYFSIITSPFYAESSVIRIRGPPSLFV